MKEQRKLSLNAYKDVHLHTFIDTTIQKDSIYSAQWILSVIPNTDMVFKRQICQEIAIKAIENNAQTLCDTYYHVLDWENILKSGTPQMIHYLFVMKPWDIYQIYRGITARNCRYSYEVLQTLHSFNVFHYFTHQMKTNLLSITNKHNPEAYYWLSHIGFQQKKRKRVENICEALESLSLHQTCSKKQERKYSENI
jgi:hypothetical protein